MHSSLTAQCLSSFIRPKLCSLISLRQFCPSLHILRFFPHSVLDEVFVSNDSSDAGCSVCYWSQQHQTPERLLLAQRVRIAVLAF